jgi:hypothetical protein
VELLKKKASEAPGDKSLALSRPFSSAKEAKQTAKKKRRA